MEPDKFRAQYEKIKNKIQNMNLRHEFGKVLSIAFRDDVFYGYTYETKDSFMIQNLDPAYCKIDTIEDGVYQFSWDCSYFNSKEGLLEFYAEEFQTAYRAYRDNGGARWVQLNPKRSICIKINEDTIDPIPPFVSLFSALADIEDYKAITKNASESSNYKAVALKIPVDDDGHLAMPRELVDTFYELLLEILPENIGAFTTPMDVKELTFEKSGALSETDAVSEAEDQFWRQAGVNSLIFGAGDDPSSSALAMSIHADEAICFRVLRQIERWVNRQLKYVSGSYKFAVKFLDVTVYNWQDISNSLTKLGQYGMPVRSALASVSQMDPPTYENMLYLENEALRLYEHEIPLQSSNTISGEVGHPTNESKGLPLSDNGEESAENE